MSLGNLKGRGTKINTDNHFEKYTYEAFNDEWYQEEVSSRTKFIDIFPKIIVNKVSIIIITKNTLIIRDLDLLSKLVEDTLVKVIISITTMDKELRRSLEPRTSSFGNKIETI